jgi:hypothetical protein
MLIVGFTILRWALHCFHFSSLRPIVTKPREICTKCFEGLVSNILQGDKMRILSKVRVKWRIWPNVDPLLFI